MAVVTTSAFEALARHEAHTLGMEDLPLLVIDHPLGGEPPGRVREKAARAVAQLALNSAASRSRRRPRMDLFASELIELDDSLEAVQAHFLERGWTDGLPIVPPTPERVRAMLAGIDAEPDHAGRQAPAALGRGHDREDRDQRRLAGCRPGALPVLVAALEAMLDPAFNLYGVQATTHPVAPLLIVNGPGAARLGMHAGAGVFGPGSAANATLGRAVRLCLLNLGGGRPGAGDMATQGSPAKYTYAIAEREDASPWGPLHVSLGFAADQTVVTVFGGEAPHNVNDHVSQRAANILAVVADTAATLGSNVGWYLAQSQLLVVLGPEHAATVAQTASRGRMSSTSSTSTRGCPWAGSSSAACGGPRTGRAGWRPPTTGRCCPMVATPGDILVMVAGGPGKHSAVVPNCCFSRAATRVVTRWPRS